MKLDVLGKELAKGILSEIGSRLPRPVFAALESSLNYLYTGRWMREHSFSPKVRVAGRAELISAAARMLGDQEVLYLEFGVWQGDTIRKWSQLLKNEHSRFHGFDSFEGLPEQWDDHGVSTLPKKKGDFTTEGKVPQISDPRVKFFKGWFEETLPHYEFVDSPNVVIFLDADLYSSTAFVLNTLKPHIKVGTILYFDEFWDRQHESRAFEEFLIETGMKFELIVATYGMRNVCFRRIE